MKNLLYELGFFRSIAQIKEDKIVRYNFSVLPNLRFKDNKNTPSCELPCVIPSKNLVVKIFPDIPSQSKRAIKNIIHYKIQSDVLPALQKLDYFYVILNHNKNTDKLCIAVFFYDMKDLHKYNNMITKQGDMCDSFIFDILPFIESIKKRKNRGTTLILQISDNYSFSGIKNENSLEYIRIISTAKKNIPKEIENTMRFYKQNHNNDVDKIEILGEDIRINKIKKINPVHIPFSTMDLIKTGLNTLSPISIHTDRKEMLLKRIVNTGYQICQPMLLLICFGLVFNLFLQNIVKTYSQKIKNMEKDLSIIKPLQKKEDQLIQSVKTRNRALIHQTTLSTHLWNLSSLIPEKIRLKNLSQQKQSSIIIEGYAEDMQNINKTIEKLKNRFYNVELESTQQEKFGTKNYIHFMIKFNTET